MVKPKKGLDWFISINIVVTSGLTIVNWAVQLRAKIFFKESKIQKYELINKFLSLFSIIFKSIFDLYTWTYLVWIQSLISKFYKISSQHGNRVKNRSICSLIVCSVIEHQLNWIKLLNRTSLKHLSDSKWKLCLMKMSNLSLEFLN